MNINQIKARQALDRLAAMPGMAAVNYQVEQMVQLANIAKKREQQGLKNKAQTLHMLFKGNPGTGKSTAARLIGEAFAAIGLLKGSSSEVPFIEIHHADITHPHVGQAERTIKEKFNKAKGGVLFIDEAYAFIGGETSHNTGDKVIAAIVQLMEDLRDEILVIAAGYPQDMDEFLESNPGLRSRFANTVHFPDFSVDELVRVAQNMLEEQEYKAAPDYLECLASILWIEKSRSSFGNARTVRNHIERSIRQQAVRLAQVATVNKQDLITLIGADLISSKEGLQVAEKEALHRIIAGAHARLLELDLKDVLKRK